MGRIVYLDSLRGFAILLVIIGHLIQFNYSSTIENPIFNVIYSFHMPLFFFLSGCTTYLSEEKKGNVDSLSKLVDQLKRKFQTLIIPSIFWTLVVPQFFVSSLHFNGNISDYWFLNTLFIVSVIWILFSYLQHYLSIRRYVTILFLFLVILAFGLGIKRISLMYLIMFIGGYYFQKYQINIHLKDVCFIIPFLLFVGLVGYFDYGDTTLGSRDRVWLEFLLSILASLILVPIFVKWNDIYPKKMNVLSWIGKYSLGIYLCHFLFVKQIPLTYLENHFTNITQFVFLLLIAFVISVVCIIIQQLLSVVPYLSGLMYGVWKK